VNGTPWHTFWFLGTHVTVCYVILYLRRLGLEDTDVSDAGLSDVVEISTLEGVVLE